jgi:hypothetical protein
MRAQVARFALTAALFVGWLGYLSYQVATRPVIATTGQPLVLSRPQLLASELDVIAEVEDTSGEATVVEVLYPPEGAPVKKGDRIQVTNIADCAPPPRPDGPAVRPDWSGPGTYLLPLRHAPDKKKYEVAAIPPSPGFYTSPAADAPVRIYPATEETRAQYRHIAEARRKVLDSDWWKRADGKE